MVVTNVVGVVFMHVYAFFLGMELTSMAGKSSKSVSMFVTGM